MTIQEQAHAFLNHFTTIKKDNDKTVYCFTNESLTNRDEPNHKILSDLLYNAAENMSTDSAYRFLVDYLEALTNLSSTIATKSELDDIALEYTDGAVDVYTSDLVAWLAESLHNVNQVNEVIADGSHEDITDLAQLLTRAQANARFQVAQAVNEILIIE